MLQLHTNKEMTEKRHDLNFVYGQARMLLQLRGVGQLCIKAVIHYPSHATFTTAEASDLIQQIVDDTLYY